MAFDLSTRFIYSPGRKIIPSEIDQTQELFEEGIQMFPKSSSLFVKYCIFLIEIKKDFPTLRHLLNQELSSTDRKHFIDSSILLHYMRNSIPRNETMTGEQETELMAAESHFHSAQRSLGSFWESLANSKQTTAVSLLGNVEDLVESERLADGLFRNIMSSPQSISATAMRSYAEFLQEIQDNKEQAEILWEEADILDATRIQTKKRSKGKVNVQVALSVQTTTPSPLAITMTVESESGSETKSQHSRASSDESGTSAGSSSKMIGRNSHSRILELRQRLLQKKSRFIQWLFTTMITAVGLCVGITIATFIVANSNVSNLSMVTTGIDGITRISSNSLEIATWFNSQTSNSNWTSVVNASFNDFSFQWFQAFNQSDDTLKANWKDVVTMTTKFSRLSNGTITSRIENMTFWDSGIDFMAHSLQVVTFGTSLIGGIDWLFVVNNAEAVSKSALLLASNLSTVNGDFQTPSNQLLVSVLSAISCLVVVSFSLFVVLLIAIEKERTRIGNLFHELPKSTCVNISEKLHKSIHSHNSQMINVISSNKLPATMRLLLLALATAPLFLAFSMVIALVFSQFSTNASNADDKMMWIGSSHSLIENINFDVQTGHKVQLVQDLETFHQRNLDAINRLALLSNDDEMTLYYGTPCPNSLLSVGVKCSGLDGLLTIFINAAEELSVSTDDWTNHSMFKRINAVFPFIREWMLDSQSIEFESSYFVLNTSNIVFIVLIVTGIVYNVIGLGWFLLQTNHINVVNARATTLLLMVPMNVLQKIESIKAFLENDGREIVTNTKAILDEQERKTKAILEASADSVIIMNEQGIIETMNPATEELLGHPSAQLIGSKCSTLMSMESARAFEEATTTVVKEAKRGRRKVVNLGKDSELTLIHKDGTRIPVLASTSTTFSITHGVTFAVFFRDIRRIKEHEAALEQERKRADLLLVNILPKDISDALKRDPGHPIAQKFESCTVMFADIVGFTPMAATMEAIEVVEFLNEIFGSWDKLCPMFRVEKIKTLGDCYMCATGIPVSSSHHAQRMIEFATCALEELEAFNTKHVEKGKQPISFRIGIHSGSGVIGGVIGARKWTFDIWGDVVQIAAKTETTGVPNRIQVTSETRSLAKDKFMFESRGKLKLGSDLEMECFLLSEGQKVKRRMKHLKQSGADTTSGSSFLTSYSTMDISSSLVH